MSYNDVPAGSDVPNLINLVIEIQKGGGRNKYEMDKETGLLTLDRVNATSIGYPADYGYIPATLCEDGDPLDALLIIDEPVLNGAVVAVRPIGVLYMIDEDGGDEKIICVPAKDISKDHIKDIKDLEPNFMPRVEQFYTHYKDWKNGWKGVEVSFNGWGGAEEAKKVITESVERAK